MGYGTAGAFSALGSGLHQFGNMLMERRQYNEEQAARQAEIDRRRADEYARDQLTRGAISPNDIANPAFEMPSDAVTLGSGVMISPSTGQADLAAEEQKKYDLELERRIKENQMLYDMSQERERKEQTRADQDYDYGPGRTRRALAQFVIEQNPDVFAGQPREVLQDPEAILAIGQMVQSETRGSGTGGTSSPSPVKMTFAQAENYVMDVVGNWDPLTNKLDANQPYKYGLTGNDVIELSRQVAAGGQIPDFGALEQQEQGASPGYLAPPPYRGPIRHDAAAPTPAPNKYRLLILS